MSQYDHFNNKTPPNNRASKFLSRFAASRSLTFSSPNRTELHNDNSNNNSSKSAAEYFALEMELQNAIEKNIILQTTTEQELFHARSRVEEASEAKRVAVEQAQLELKQAKDESQKLNSSLESERTKVRFLLKKTKALEDSMIEGKKEHVAEIKFQENVTERWKADMASDSKLSKSVRPVTLIFLFVSTVLLIFIDSGFINFAVDDEWKELLKMLLITITAAYFGGRSYEKGNKIKQNGKN